MHTILILSDTIKNQDNQIVRKLKGLFPDCNIQILSRTAAESKRRNNGPAVSDTRFRALQFENQPTEYHDFL